MLLQQEFTNAHIYEYKHTHEVSLQYIQTYILRNEYKTIIMKVFLGAIGLYI